jgi:hypothetical protein
MWARNDAFSLHPRTTRSKAGVSLKAASATSGFGKQNEYAGVGYNPTCSIKLRQYEGPRRGSNPRPPACCAQSPKQESYH